MYQDIDHVLIYRSEIQDRIGELAEEISSACSNGLVIVPIMNGAMIFVSDLIRQLPIKMQIDLMTISSYDGITSGEPVLRSDIEIPIENRDVLIVDDILDTGKTLAFAKSRIADCRPASIKTCVLLRRGPHRDEPDFFGFRINENHFVVGYGLDFNGYYRNYPHIAVLK